MEFVDLNKEEAREAGRRISNKIIEILEESLVDELTPQMEFKLRAGVNEGFKPEPKPTPKEEMINYCEVTALFVSEENGVGASDLAALANTAYGADNGQLQGLILSHKTGRMTRRDFNALDAKGVYT